MFIYFDTQNKIFKLDTQKTSYIFCVSEANVTEHLYYGARISDIDLRYIACRGIGPFAFATSEAEDYSMDAINSEYPSANAGDYRTAAISVENADGTKGNRLRYKSHRIYTGKEAIEGLPFSRSAKESETLAVLLTDEQKGIEVEIFYTVYPAQDVITRYQKITNKAKGSAYLEKASSLCVDFSEDEYDMLELTGLYGYERGIVQRSTLQKGVRASGTTIGASSHHTNPFFALVAKNTDENSGDAYGFNLVYSGSFLNEVEVDRFGKIRAVSGINPAVFRWELKQGESFTTPEAIMTYSEDGIGGMSRNFHDHIRENLIEQAFVNKTRPIVANTWEGTHLEVSESYVLALADETKKVGADTVVLDDGWFRDDICTGLGDWRVIKEKFPHGLKWLANEIHKKGLKFGIWVEPEMAAKNSDFVRNYPEKILKTRNDPFFSRNQYVIDLTDDETVDYIFDTITSALDGVEMDYIKWDANRYLTETGSKNCPSGEVYHRQMLGVYKLFEKFKKKYPNVLFENCSGGGGRFDLGMLYYAPQIWTSDNTDPNGRAYIQYGTSLAYPTSTMSCHYTASTLSSFTIPSEFRYLVAAFGPYGYELDLTKLSEEEKSQLKAYTEKYREIERFNIDCDFYRLISPQTDWFSAYMQVTKDKKQALLTFLQLSARSLKGRITIKLKGLDENTVYENTETGMRMTGKGWMHVGVIIDRLMYDKSGSGKQIVFRAVE